VEEGRKKTVELGEAEAPGRALISIDLLMGEDMGGEGTGILREEPSKTNPTDPIAPEP